MQSRLLEQIPRFGWNKKTLIDDVAIGDGGGADPLTTDPVERPPGMFQAAVQLSIVGGSSSGVGEIGVVLEGSNSGDGTNDLEWFPIASLAIDSLFTVPDANDQFRLMGSIPSGYQGTSGNINLGRFAYVRLRAEAHIATITVLSAPTTAPTATLTIEGVVLTPAGGPRTPGNNDYDNTLGTTGAIATEIAAAINDVANDFKTDVLAVSVTGSDILLIPGVQSEDSGFSLISGLPAELEVPSYSITARMSGISGDGEKFLRTKNATSDAGDPVDQTSNGYIERPAGTRFMTATAKLVSGVWTPANATGLSVQLQGAVDKESADAGNFILIQEQFLTAPPLLAPPVDGLTQLFDPSGGIVIDMGPYNFFRISVAAAGATPPTDATAYTVLFSLAFDDNDWLDGESNVAKLSSTLQSQFLQVRWGTPQPQVGTTVTLPGQFVDFNGVPVKDGASYAVYVVCSDDSRDKYNSPHPTATLTSLYSQGSVTGTTRILVGRNQADFTVVVDSNGAPTTAYISADYYVDSPSSALFPYILVSSEVAAVVLT